MKPVASLEEHVTMAIKIAAGLRRYGAAVIDLAAQGNPEPLNDLLALGEEQLAEEAAEQKGEQVQ